MKTSESIDLIAPAFVKLQSLLEGELVKESTGTGDDGEYGYASLPAAIAYTREALSVCEIAMSQDVTNLDNGIAITTRAIHSSGQWFEWGPLAIVCRTDARSIGSATTYGRRYARNAALDIAAADDEDDGAAASAGAPKAATPAQATKPDAAPKRATENQVRKVYSLGKQLGLTDDETAAAALAFIQEPTATHPGDLDRKQASTVIDELSRRVKAKAGDPA